MTGIVIKKIIWDEWNQEHIKRHNLTVEEVETAIDDFIAHKKGNKGRYILIGRCKGRLVSVVINRKAECTYYIVTARDADKKERKIVYEKE